MKTDFEGSLVETKVCPSVEDKKALQIMEKTLKIVDGHFQVALPWRNNPPYLPNNKIVAERRGLLLKKRLLRDDELLKKYRTTLNEYLEKGYAEKIPKEQLDMENRPIWYLPHHPVTHPLKPEKVRVVYDCAASYGRTSLNQQLLQGPDQTNQLTGVLIQFREESVAMVADVEAMFHQVLVEPRDCDALRFLWWPSEDLSGEMEEYRMTRHLFGATSSPSVANFCLRKTAELHQDEFNPVAIETVKRNMYVDDMMKSAKETSEAIGLVSQLRHLLEKGGFRLTKWYSNSREVMKTIPETERAKSMKDLELDRLPTESALGIKWNTEEDKFEWDVSEKMLRLVNEASVTRRAIVSAVYSLFDPLGFIAPYVMKAKLLLQMLCRKGVGWDDPLQENEKAQWKRWLADLPKLQAIRVDRCFKPVGFGVVKEIQLHLFSDASRLGYSAVAYLRLEDTNEQIHCAFVMGKARLAPLREISIPRLELTAAVISVRLSKIIQEELDLEIERIYYWTDSMSVLKCINNESKRFHTFESNRLTVIRSGSDPTQWMYVNRDDNHADDGSKGVKLDAMISNDRWLNGPEFLLKDETHWPTMIQVPVLKSDDPEVRKEAQIYATTVRCNVLEKLISHHSSWWKLKCSVAWLLRCKECLRAKVKLKKSSVVVDTEVETTANVGRLTIEELKAAEDEILRHVQLTAFPEELKILTVAERAKKPDKVFLRKTGMSLRQYQPERNTEEGERTRSIERY